MGLSIPYTHFKGELSFIGDDKYTDRNFAKRSNGELLKFLNYLTGNANVYDALIDLKSFKGDISKGLYFESSIPESYGLGSSGALCAAIYKNYGIDPISNDGKLDNADIIKLKNILSLLESGFHGKSSGLDPLNSYLKVPLLIHNQNEIEQVNLPGEKFGEDSAIFLINTGQSGNTEPLVNAFLTNCEDSNYLKKMQKELIPLNNNCIKELVNGNANSFFEKQRKLSAFQLENFKAMIPEEFFEIWEKGLDSNNYYMKLCGSGGGGFLLGFTRSYSKARTAFTQKGFEVVTVYQNEM